MAGHGGDPEVLRVRHNSQAMRRSHRVLSSVAFVVVLFVLTWFAGLTGSVIYGEVFGLPRVGAPPGLQMTLSAGEQPSH